MNWFLFTEKISFIHRMGRFLPKYNISKNKKAFEFDQNWIFIPKNCEDVLLNSPVYMDDILYLSNARKNAYRLKC